MKALEFVTTNAVKSKARREKLHGRDFLVASSILLVPGVLNGSKGPLFYSAEETSRDPMAWNHMPIVGYHPTVDGKPVSARSPDILDKQQLGFVFKASGGDKLASELWYDEELTRNFDQTLADSDKILPRLERGDPIELSTGLFMRERPAPEGSVHNGKPFTAYAEDLAPDHLATLPDMTGACSIKDGCGVGVNAAADQTEPASTLLQKIIALFKPATPITNQLSHEQLRQVLSTLLSERFDGRKPMNPADAVGDIDYGWCYIVEVYDKYILFSLREKTWKLGYSHDLRNSEVKLDTEMPTEVTRIVTWKAVTNSEEPNMAKRDDIIKQLAANCDCWKGDEKTLATFSEEKLELLHKQHEKATAKPVPEPKINAETIPIATPVSQEQLIASLIPSIASIVANSLKEQGQKQALVNQLTACITDPVRKAAREAVLMNEQVAELVERVKDLPPVENQEPVGYYGLAAGRSPQINNEAKAKDENDVLPIVNMSCYEELERKQQVS